MTISCDICGYDGGGTFTDPGRGHTGRLYCDNCRPKVFTDLMSDFESIDSRRREHYGGKIPAAAYDPARVPLRKLLTSRNKERSD